MFLRIEDRPGPGKDPPDPDCEKNEEKINWPCSYIIPNKELFNLYLWTRHGKSVKHYTILKYELYFTQKGVHF